MVLQTIQVFENKIHAHFIRFFKKINYSCMKLLPFNSLCKITFFQKKKCSHRIANPPKNYSFRINIWNSTYCKTLNFIKWYNFCCVRKNFLWLKTKSTPYNHFCRRTLYCCFWAVSRRSENAGLWIFSIPIWIMICGGFLEWCFLVTKTIF